MRIAYKSFTGGEIAPSLAARYDLQKYGTSVQCMENLYPGLHGDVARRPGTRFVAELDHFAMLIPFSFNAEPSNNACLVFSHQKMRISDGTRLLPDVVRTPYLAEHVAGLRWAQVGDVVYLAHPSYPLHKVTRRGTPPYVWNLEEVIFNASLPAPDAPSVSFVWATNNNEHDDTAADMTHPLCYKVVAVDARGKESLASPAGETMGKHPSDWVTGNRAVVSWRGVPDAAEYNIYREEAGYFGFVGSVKAVSHTPPDATQLQALANLRALAETRTRERDAAEALYLSLKDRYSSECYVTSVEGETAELVTKPCTDLKAEREATLKKWEALKTEAFTLQSEYGTLHARLFPAHTFTDNNYEADISDTPREDWNPFADGNHPGVVAFHQQRMVLAGTQTSPQALYLSRVGDFENFRKSRPMKDDDPLEYHLASSGIDAVQWCASFGDLLIGTSGAEYKASGDGGPITAANVSISAQSNWGSAGLAPLLIGNSVLHVQRHGGRVRDLFYSLERDGYAGNDLSVLAPHLFEGHRLVQWAYQQSPGSNIWVVRDDGLLLCLTYLKEHEIYGWSRHPTAGKVVSVATLSGPLSDVLMLVTRRVIDGRERYFLERMAEPFRAGTPIEEAYFVDAGVTARRYVATDSMTGLDHLEGETLAVVADGSPVEGCVVRGGAIVLPWAAKVVHAGLPYTSVLAPLPVEADTQAGTTLGKRRAFGKCLARFDRIMGGSYGADRDNLYDFPFLPDAYDLPCAPFTGDLEFSLDGAQDAAATLWIVQDRPLPLRLLALVADVDFGEQ